MPNETFLHKLDAATARNRSLICVGLDPDPARLPVRDVAGFCRGIIDATQDLVCAYKPNLAFFEAQGVEGLRALEATVKAVPSYVPVIADAKRGDIGNTAGFYARALFETWGFDAATVNPLLGGDSVEPFTAYEKKGVLILCRTSNPGAADLQSLPVPRTDGRGAEPLYLRIARLAQGWNARRNVGLVVGATAPRELADVRTVCGDMPILIPGVGAQGGDMEDAVRLGATRDGRRAVVNVSRGVIFAGKGADYASAARAAAIAYRDAANRAAQGLSAH